METACLRIKFTPLLQEAKKSSEKCCLEIVPEVSCIQNLDKLTWKQENNYIEYTIPMTYKIILRKRQKKDTSDEMVKTYHSCVDLLLSPSKSNIDLASGDISRIISDPFILSKIPTTMTKEDIINMSTRVVALNDKLSKIIQSDARISDSTVLEITDLSHNKPDEAVVNDDNINSYPQQNCQTNDDKILCEAFTSTEDILSMSSNDIILEKQEYILKQHETKPKLCLSPICSINTQDTEFLPLTNTASKGITCKIYDSQKDLVPLGCISNEYTNEEKVSSVFSQVGSLPGQNSTKIFPFPCHDRSPPEIRVAQYVHYMERELRPLNITLDELINKCTVLGIYQASRNVMKSTSNNLFFYKSVCMYNNHITTETRERSMSNRAVYSIVFDG